MKQTYHEEKKPNHICLKEYCSQYGVIDQDLFDKLFNVILFLSLFEKQTVLNTVNAYITKRDTFKVLEKSHILQNSKIITNIYLDAIRSSKWLLTSLREHTLVKELLLLAENQDD